MSVALIALCILWFGLIAYAVLGGADFGAGIWNLFAVGPQAKRQIQLINKALGPVWEANHVWLIFLIVGLFSVFPSAFAVLSIALFIPLTLALIGIVLRGSAFIFRTYAIDSTAPTTTWWSRVFSTTSLATPFFLGAAAAAVASGKIDVTGSNIQSDFSSWTSPYALTIGAMAIALCASLAAVYLSVEAHNGHDEELTETYRLRAIIAGAITAVLGALGLLLSISEAPILWHGLITRAWPVVIATMLIGLATAAALFYRKYSLARILIILETAFLLGSWGLSQYPYIIPPRMTIENAANDPNVIVILLISIGIGMVLILPALYYLFSVFKLPTPAPGVEKNEEPAASEVTQKKAT